MSNAVRDLTVKVPFLYLSNKVIAGDHEEEIRPTVISDTVLQGWGIVGSRIHV
jgi:hypothetical protein